MILALFLACAPRHVVSELETRLADLEAQQAADQVRLDALEAEVARLSAAASNPNPPGADDPAAPTGPQCTLVGDRVTLPADDVDLDALSTMARVIPHKGADGAADGMRLSGIRRGSLFDSCGLKNGDVVHAVNGMPLTNAEASLEAYSTQRTATSYRVEISRRGQRITLEWSRP